MQAFILLAHVFICAAMIGIILLQKSEGGALGIGGGGGFMAGRGQANFLTRMTAWLAIAFFCTSMVLTILAQRSDGGGLLDRLQNRPTSGTTQPAQPAPAPAGGGLLDRLQNAPAEPTP